MTKSDRRIQKHDDGRNGFDPFGIESIQKSSGNYIPNHQYDQDGQFLALQDIRIGHERPPEHVDGRNARIGKRANGLYKW